MHGYLRSMHERCASYRLCQSLRMQGKNARLCRQDRHMAHTELPRDRLTNCPVSTVRTRASSSMPRRYVSRFPPVDTGRISLDRSESSRADDNADAATLRRNGPVVNQRICAIKEVEMHYAVYRGITGSEHTNMDMADMHCIDGCGSVACHDIMRSDNRLHQK